MNVTVPALSTLITDVSIRTTKTKTGCKTCKIRRVKCDEEKPHCVRCTSTGRSCSYEGQKPITPSNNTLSKTPNTVWNERRAFAYYFQQASTTIGGSLDITFWRNVVPRVCQSEPAVWDAINCISTIFENRCLSPNIIVSRTGTCTLDANHRAALGWYSRAVSSVRSHISQGKIDLFVGLVTCTIFICIEALQGSEEAATKLYRQGVQLIYVLRVQVAAGTVSAEKAELLEGTIVPLFLRLSVLALTASAITEMPLLCVTDTQSIKNFNSLQHARDSIVSLSAEVRMLQMRCDEYIQQFQASPPTELALRRVELVEQLGSWRDAFTALLKITPNAWRPEESSVIALLYAYAEMLHIILWSCLAPTEICMDAYITQFRSIVSYAQHYLQTSARKDGTQPPYTFELSVGVPLWFTCLRCRDPSTRRQALILLRTTPRVQGLYVMDNATRLVEAIIILEETAGRATLADNVDSIADVFGNSEGSVAKLVPDEARIGPIGLLRPGGGFSLVTPGLETMMIEAAAERPLLGFWRGVKDNEGGRRKVYGYVPVDV